MTLCDNSIPVCEKADAISSSGDGLRPLEDGSGFDQQMHEAAWSVEVDFASLYIQC